MNIHAANRERYKIFGGITVMKIKNVNLKEIFIRLVLLFCGLMIAHLGVTLFLLANLGADPFNVFVRV